VTAPLVQTVTPASGSQHGGTSVTLSGLRLTNTNGSAPSVSIGGNPATVTGATQGSGGAPDQVTLITPAGAPGPAAILRLNDHGPGAPPAGFTYQAGSKTPFAVEADTLMLWHLDENAGPNGRVFDAGPLNINGTLSGNASTAPGRFGLGKVQ